MIRVNRKGTLLNAGMLAVLCGQTLAAPTGTAFTYQGRLTENGAPANGAYDIQFRLFDGAAGAAAQVGGTVTATELPVVNGLFTANLDFGAAAFDGAARWLELAVFDPVATQYVPLSPRQYLAATPYATHALSSAQWKSVGNNITNSNTGFVGVNRSGPLTSAEFFGIQAPVDSDYGGMYIRTDGGAGKPFYGYRAAGVESAWTYLDGATGDWRVYNDGDRLTVTETGNVGIATTMPAAKLHAKQAGSSGEAARIEITHAENWSNTLSVKNFGLGRGAYFENSNINNTWPALEVQHHGTGLAGKFVGEVEMHGDVTVDGPLYARFGNSDFARGTPIAFGSFEPFTNSPTLLTSSGNVALSYVSGQGFRIQVQGEGDPQNWTVVASVTYDSLDDGVFHIVKAGEPLAVAGQPGTGVVYMKTQCVGCGEFINYYYINFVIYKGN